MVTRKGMLFSLAWGFFWSLCLIWPAFSQEEWRLVEVGRTMIDFGQHDPMEFRQLVVDRRGALYFASRDKILKFDAHGERELEIEMGRYGVALLEDLDVDGGDHLVVAGTWEDSGRDVTSRVLVFNREGTLVASFDRPKFLVKRVVATNDGELFLAGVQSPGSLVPPFRVRLRVLRLGLDGEVRGVFGEREMPVNEGARYWQPFLGVVKGACFLMEDRGDAALLRTFSPEDGALLRSVEISFPHSPMPEEVAGAAQPRHVTVRVRIDRFLPLNSRWALLTGGTTYTWRPGDAPGQMRSVYRVFILSTEEGHLAPVQKGVEGVVKTVGEDGFIYLVSSVVTSQKVRLQVTKARLHPHV